MNFSTDLAKGGGVGNGENLFATQYGRMTSGQDLGDMALEGGIGRTTTIVWSNSKVQFSTNCFKLVPYSSLPPKYAPI